jgi:hypothetical protein
MSRNPFFILVAPMAAAALVVFAGCSGGSTGSNPPSGPGGSGGDSNPIPTLTSVSPNKIAAGSPGTTFTLTGANFIGTSKAVWNGTELLTTYKNATTLTAFLPPPVFATAGTHTLTVANPAPGGGSSAAASFTVGAVTLTTTSVPVIANDIAWDPVYERIYLSLIGSTMTNGTSVQALDPNTGKLGTAVAVGVLPDRLAVSVNSKYLYVGLDSGYVNGSITVPGGFVMPVTLPDLNLGPVFPLGYETGGITPHNYVAQQIEPAPGSDDTVAIIRGDFSVVSSEVGGIVIYDNGNPRPNRLCGDGEVPRDDYGTYDNCIGANPGHGPNGYIWDSIVWSPDGTQVYSANGETTIPDFYKFPVDSQGFSTVTTYSVPYVGGLIYPQLYFSIHYDIPTSYVYSDNGLILNPADGSVVANLGHAGNAIPDGKLGVVFLLWWNASSSGFELDSFDIHSYALIASQILPQLNGTPVKVIRWGSDGLAVLALANTLPNHPPAGGLYVLRGPFIGNPKSPGN